MKQIAGVPRERGFFQAAEWAKHEGTWLQWPHDWICDGYQMKLERTWLEMTRALADQEIVHIIANNEAHREHIAHQLTYHGIGAKNIDLRVIPTNDVWVRDNGPIFIINDRGELAVTDWNFNGWGGRFDHPLDARVSAGIAHQMSLPIYTAPLVLEGGGLSVNGCGTLLATTVSIINSNRNPGLDQENIEQILSDYLGIKHCIWLKGAGEGECEKWGDATDSHIDIVARFTDESTVIYNWTDDKNDPRYVMFKRAYEGLKEAATESGRSLTLVPLPIPRNGVFQVSDGIDWRQGRLTDGVYSNYYTANGVVLVPVYGNVNDARAKAIIGEQFPGRKVIGIDAVSLIEHGGAIGCVTQPQPARQYQDERTVESPDEDLK